MGDMMIKGWDSSGVGSRDTAFYVSWQQNAVGHLGRWAVSSVNCGCRISVDGFGYHVPSS